MDALVKKHNLKALKLTLANLPESLDKTYDEVLERIRSQDTEDVDLAMRVLSWITHAFRPLTIQELQHALAVTSDDTELDEDALTDVELLISVCAGIVTIDQESNVIRLVHYTTQEYFARVRKERFPDGHFEIASTCIAYLSFDAFSEGPCPSGDAIDSRFEKHSLLLYAAVYWGDHARESPEQKFAESILSFLGEEHRVSSLVQATHVAGNRSHKSIPKHLSAVHVAAAYGLGETVLRLLENEHNADSKDNNGRTPLSWAAENGHEAVVRLLVDRADVDADSKDNYGITPLSRAAENGHEAAVRLLVDRADVDADSKDNYGITPLSRAALSGHEAVVRLLVDRADVDADSKDNYGITPLSRAAQSGHEAVVRLLVDRADVEADSKDNNGRTPLFWATTYGGEAVVQLLVDRADVDADSKDNEGHTPLFWATTCGREGVVRLLVDRIHRPREGDGRSTVGQGTL
jgi:ankyrin repeat protein